MKRLTLTTAVLAILMAPAAFAQSTLNTTAPGASQETKPGQTNNNLQNPGSKMTTPPATTMPEPAPAPAPEATGTMNSTDTTTNTTGTTYNSTPPATDTTTTTTGTMNNDNTGAYTGSTSTTTSSKLPKTASDLPTVMMAGLLALFAAFALRFYSKRNA